MDNLIPNGFYDPQKLRFYKLSKLSRIKEDEIVKIFENPEFEKMKNGLIEAKELINNPLIYKFSNKISNLIIGQFLKIIKEKCFSDFFINIITNFNLAIVCLEVISRYYKESYEEKEKEKEKAKEKEKEKAKEEEKEKEKK